MAANGKSSTGNNYGVAKEGGVEGDRSLTFGGKADSSGDLGLMPRPEYGGDKVWKDVEKKSQAESATRT